MFRNINGYYVNAAAVILLAVEKTIPRRGEPTYHVQLYIPSGNITISEEYAEKYRAELERDRIIGLLSGEKVDAAAGDLFSQAMEDADRTIASQKAENEDLKGKLDELKNYVAQLEAGGAHAGDGMDKPGRKTGKNKD